MKRRAFDRLVKSVRQAGRIRRGEPAPARVTSVRGEDIKAIRARLGKTQVEFALMIGVSPATLRVAARHPGVVKAALGG